MKQPIHFGINAFRKFLQRDPFHRMSDRGTNFIEVKRELAEALDEMNHDKVGRLLMNENCWRKEIKVCALSASQMGGSCERQIRGVFVLTMLLMVPGAQLED